MTQAPCPSITGVSTHIHLKDTPPKYKALAALASTPHPGLAHASRMLLMSSCCSCYVCLSGPTSFNMKKNKQWILSACSLLGTYSLASLCRRAYHIMDRHCLLSHASATQPCRISHPAGQFLRKSHGTWAVLQGLQSGRFGFAVQRLSTSPTLRCGRSDNQN